MQLRANPKLKWQGNPIWDPPSWSWVHTIGLPTSPNLIHRGKLISARTFADRGGVAAIELTVAFEGVKCSTVLRLDNPALVTSFSEQLKKLRGFTLKQIGEMELDEKDVRFIGLKKKR